MEVNRVIYAKIPGKSNHFRIEFDPTDPVYRSLRDVICRHLEQMALLDFYLVGPGSKVVSEISDVSEQQTFLEVRPILKGGKGGYGALMKNQAAQKRKFTCTLAARDLSGRLVRDIKNEIRMKKWLKKKMIDQNIAANSKEEKRENPKTAEVKRAADELLSGVQSSIKNSIHVALFGETEPDSDPSTPSAGHDSPKASGSLAPLSQSSRSSKEQSPPSQKLKKDERVAPDQEKREKFSLEDLKDLTSEAMVRGLPAEMLKGILRDLGVKCGGSPQERATRLWEICQKPSRVMDKKYRV